MNAIDEPRGDNHAECERASHSAPANGDMSQAPSTLSFARAAENESKDVPSTHFRKTARGSGGASCENESKERPSTHFPGEQGVSHLERSSHIAEVSGQFAHVRKLVLDEIQGAFPIEPDPYGVLARRLDIERSHALGAVESLRADGTIRRIGASFSSQHLGYRSSLCAISVQGGEEDVDRAGELVSAHPEVTHNYLRNDVFNIWFTVIAPSLDDIARVAAEVGYETGCAEVLNLPAKTIFKIKVDFGGADSGVRADEAGAPFDPRDAFDVALVRWAQGDALGEHPYADIAASLGVSEQRVVKRLRSWVADGTMRRFGSIVAHRKMGYAFNGMTVWDAGERTAELGRAFAELPSVSHCYERPRAESWPYDLYAMVHAKTREELDSKVAELADIAGFTPKVLLSSKEFKKMSPVYFAN